LYIYVSNETPNVDVFFDNLQVTHIRGPLLEETHYYPFGLTMAGISSKAAGKLENKNDKFQGQPLDDDLGLNWYGFKWRNHDPQIGRFIQIDPLANDYVYNSTYAFSENKVTAHVELEGLESAHFSLKDVWRAGGISSSSDPKQFVANTAKQALKPEAWVQGYAAAGQIAMPLVLTGIMTGGLGEPAILQAEAKVLQPKISLSSSVTEESSVVSLSNLESRLAAPNFLVDSKGTAYPVPEGSVGPVPVNSGKGIQFVEGKGGANGQVANMRVMDATPPKGNAPGYPEGYIKYTNVQGQGVNPYTGQTGSKANTHFPINGNVTPPASDATRVKKPVILTPEKK
jgi:RHS repeat-associated protein